MGVPPTSPSTSGAASSEPMGSEVSIELKAGERKLVYDYGNGEGDAPIEFKAPEFDLGVAYRHGITKRNYTILGLQPFFEIGGSVGLTNTTSAAEAFKPAECTEYFMGTCVEGAGGNYAGATANGDHGSVTLQASVGTPLSFLDLSFGGYAQHRIFGDSAMAPFMKYDGAGNPIMGTSYSDTDINGDGVVDDKDSTQSPGSHSGMQNMLNNPLMNWEAGIRYHVGANLFDVGKVGTVSIGFTHLIPLTGSVTFQATEVGTDDTQSITNHDSPISGHALKGDVTFTFGGAGRTDLLDLFHFGGGGGRVEKKEKKKGKGDSAPTAAAARTAATSPAIDMAPYAGMSPAEKLTAIQEDPTFQAGMQRRGITRFEPNADASSVAMVTPDATQSITNPAGGPVDVDALIAEVLKPATAPAAPAEPATPAASGKRTFWDKITFWDKESKAAKKD